MLSTPSTEIAPATPHHLMFYLDRLVGYCHNPIDRQLTEQMIVRLQPLADQMASDYLILAEPRQIDVAKLKRAITSAYGISVEQIIFVSEWDPTKRLIEATRGMPEEAKKAALNWHLTKVVKYPTQPGHWRYDDLYKVIRSSIPDSPRTYPPNPEMRDSLRMQLYIALSYNKYNRKRAKKFAPLVELMTTCYPLGPYRDDPRIWFVACR